MAESRSIAVDRLRLVGPPETNKVMAAELSRLARRAIGRVPPRPARQGSGTLLYPWEPELGWVAAQYHRTSARVLWDLYESKAMRLEPLYREVADAAAADARGWCAGGATISVEARNVDRFPAGFGQIVGAVKNGLIEGFAARGVELEVDAARPDLRIWVRGHDDTLAISLDLWGRSRHLRGYRTEAGEAPLREPLAAALVMLARFDARSEVLVDPMAGSGTIAIEAALMGSAAPLVVGPESLLAPTPALAAVRDRERPPLFADTRATVIASDVDPRATAMTEANARRAGVGDQVAAINRDVAALDRATIERLAGRPVSGGLILGNPPYGERLAYTELAAIYRELRRFCDRLGHGWRAAFLVNNPDFLTTFGTRPRISKPMRTGGMRAYFYLFDL